MSLKEVVVCLDQLYEESCLDLFSGLGCHIVRSPHEPCPIGDAPTASIDAGSEDLEFFIALTIPEPVLNACRPGGPAETEEEMEDWLGEIANQMVGKFKAKLLHHECTVQIGLPHTHYDESIEALLPERKLNKIYEFIVDDHPFLCALSIDILNRNPNFNLNPPEEDSVGDGELEFF